MTAMDTNGDASNERISEESQITLLEEAQHIVEGRTKRWSIFEDHMEERIPRFEHDEIELAGELGKGGFFVVSEVRAIHLKFGVGEQACDNSVDSGSDGFTEREMGDNEKDDFFHSVVQDRRFMAKHCLRHDKDPRYAFKTMQSVNLEDADTFLSAAVDLAIEFKFLSALRHPNILKMRAVSTGSLFQPNAFLILDKIYDTVEARIEKWKLTEQSVFNRIFDFHKKKEKFFLAKRLLVAYDIASALSYMHNMNIMYRDLKPSNVGFDVRDDPKLFDFGLATEFRPEEIKNGTYKLTGDTGTMRYMAPEVAQSRPYTEKVDVYSFGIMLWQMIQLEIPFGKLQDDAIERKVVQLGFRPKIDSKWRPAIRRLLQDCFASSPRRPSMEGICTVLRHEIRMLSDKELLDEEELMESARSAMSARYI